MNKPIAAFISLLAVLSIQVFSHHWAWAQVERATPNSQLPELVKNLGLANEEVSSDFDVLETNAHLAAKLLVKELHPIPRRAYYPTRKTRESRHVIACLRALRYLTGNSFSAPTREVLKPDEKQFLDFNREMHDANPEHHIHFFGVWMSRNADFVAPADAQQKIIEQWQKWQIDQGETFRHSPPKAKDCMDDWFWFG